MSSWTLVAQAPSTDVPAVDQLKTALESKSDAVKIETMRLILTLMYNGDPLPGVLMHVIRFVMPSRSKALKKLLYFYWEVCPKHGSDGKLKQEMILVCNAIRNDLQHPNEYIRGYTLRFLTKLKDVELLEPLVPTCRQNLEHRQAYVRKSAVLAVYSIYQQSEHLIPDAPDLINSFLVAETDATCRRNAFVVLTILDHVKAATFLVNNFSSITSMDELMQLSIIDFIRKDVLLNPQNKAQYLKLIFDLLDTPINTVAFEAASALTLISTNPAAVQAAASKIVELIVKEPDNNAKLIMLDRIDELRKTHVGLLEDFVLQCLNVLSSPDLDVRRKALTIALEMISSRTVEEFVNLLKKELTKSMERDYDKTNEYRQLLIGTVHKCAMRFPQVASNVVYLLMDFIAEMNTASAADIINFVKEVVERFPQLRQSIIERLLLTLAETKAGRVYRGALWVIGEYCDTDADVRAAWKQIRASIGEVPIIAAEQRHADQANDAQHESEAHQSVDLITPSSIRTRVLADGTYATESAVGQEDANKKQRGLAPLATNRPPLRSLILDGDFYLATVLSATLTKLVMRYASLTEDGTRVNALRAEAMLIMTSIVRAGQSAFSKQSIDEDSLDRIMSCLKSLADFQTERALADVFLEDTKQAFTDLVGAVERKRTEQDQQARQRDAVQVDDLLSIRQLCQKEQSGVSEVDHDVRQAVGDDSVVLDTASKLSKVRQLTGFSDPIYVEAYVTVNQFDIVLDILMVNQTEETLQNLSLEFATIGNMKIVERPTPVNLSAHAFASTQCVVKVSSTDTGVVFGNAVYDDPKTKDSKIVILSELRINITDYIQPAICTEAAFRSMWTEFEWENKVAVLESAAADGFTGPETSVDSPVRRCLESLMSKTNMACLTPVSGLSGDCAFLSANLYAKSIFGEHALANVSLEQQTDGSVSGHVRVRSKTQGIALSVGELVTKSSR
ncbi:coatomer subunit beta [Savitreella phatthalungensis]